MKKDSIIHFVGFVTRLPQSEFVDQWSTYAKAFKSLGSATTLQGKSDDAGRFKYISQHEFNEEEFRFAFTSERQSGNFPDQKARVVMLGGYSPVKIGSKRWDDEKFSKVMVFVNQDNIDMDYYYNLVGSDQLNVYQPFYENCVYQVIMEFFVPAEEVPELIRELTERKEGVEISLYRKCPTFASAMK
jgi:hypothetical protein